MTVKEKSIIFQQTLFEIQLQSLSGISYGGQASYYRSHRLITLVTVVTAALHSYGEGSLK